MDLELFKQVFRDDRLHILIGLIKRVAVSSDRSDCQVVVSILPEKRNIVAKMSWEAIGSNAGLFMLPNVNDLVLVGQVEGDNDQAFIIRRLTSPDDKIPLNATDGDFVMKSLDGKKVWITSDTRINLSAGDSVPNENLVLGQVLKAALSTMLQAIADHTHIGNMGYSTSPPENASAFTTLKSSPVDNEGMLSDLSFTEKG